MLRFGYLDLLGIVKIRALVLGTGFLQGFCTAYYKTSNFQVSVWQAQTLNQQTPRNPPLKYNRADAQTMDPYILSLQPPNP